ncbi:MULTISPECIES: DUF2752 domain-containing protein [Flavobacteriaceae]|jgi:hypothetical protein|uniref:DUF2752 domain-containing protein n=2 Tax=Flavobacteriaceae TaxID=49546 RepID=A0ABN1JPJ7_9FLAO|nr:MULTISPECIES: DUF2752 domain-containing protein [Flavobacteriaceae]RYH74112.1 DUF2752 domain-containing protein [Flavobacteriaceae bacterium 144Ye]TBV25885.1 hypothetical protein DMZ43_08220 [Meridianimaribacter sp. CL38]TDY11256.1 uncharacterized protein DUF2752 [Meridianimaribacter flavus]
MSQYEDYMLPCLNKKLFGFECMGCGMQRSVALILEGDFIGAFFMYPAIYTLILLFGMLIVNALKIYEISQKIILTLVIINIVIIVGNFLLKII